VSLTDVNQTLDMYLGSLYVNSYNDFGRHWQVTVQAEGQYRQKVEDIKPVPGAERQRPNGPAGDAALGARNGRPGFRSRATTSYTSAAISGNILGVSSGDAIKNINRIAAETLPISMKAEWTEIMFMQIRAGDNRDVRLSAVTLCASFWPCRPCTRAGRLPLAVILVVPLCLLSSVAGVLFTSIFTPRDVNIFVQIGLVVLVGLACKNAIVIVEYAKQPLHQEGPVGLRGDPGGVRRRCCLRPILMTSFAFIFGVAPLVIASGGRGRDAPVVWEPPSSAECSA